MARLGIDQWEQVAGAWLMSCSSENTRSAYRRDLAQYVGFVTGLGIANPLAASRPAVDAYARHLQAAGLTPRAGPASSPPLTASTPTPAQRVSSTALLDDALGLAADGGPLVRGARGGAIDRHQALRMVEALGRAAGVAHALCPHDCRHTAATMALDAGAPIHRVQGLLGHASPATTQRYVAHRERLDSSAAYVLGKALAG